MSYLRSTQVISNWIGENSLLESGMFTNVIMNKVNSVFSTEHDVRLNMYYKDLYEQKVVINKKTEWILAPKQSKPYHPTLISNTIDHSAKAPHIQSSEPLTGP